MSHVFFHHQVAHVLAVIYQLNKDTWRDLDSDDWSFPTNIRSKSSVFSVS